MRPRPAWSNTRLWRGVVGTGVALTLLGGGLAGCGASRGDDQAGDPAGTSAASAPAATTSASATSMPPSSPASADDPTSSAAATATRPPPNPGPGPLGVKVTRPPAGVAATGPAVVLVHGGVWVGGNPDLMDAWAQALAESGAVVFNASYRLVYRGGGYPASVDDIACAVRYARAEAPALTTSDELVIMGHSAGGHLAAVVALNGDSFGADCEYPAADPPDRLVGLAGLYDVRRFGSLFELFVGAAQEAEPARWTSVNPVELAGGRDDLPVALVVGADDDVVPRSEAAAFEAALAPGGGPVAVQVVAGAGHNDLLDPAVVGLGAVGFDG